MRRIASVLVLPLAWYAMGCGDGRAGDDQAAGSGRDLTTVNADIGGDGVISDLELGRTDAPAETPVTVASKPAQATGGAAESSESHAPEPAPALVRFTDGIDLASEPQMIDASLPVLGAGSGTLLRPGITVAAAGNPIDLFRPTRVGDSPWPEARTGEYATVSRDGMGLVIGRGSGGGHCPAPGLF